MVFVGRKDYSVPWRENFINKTYINRGWVNNVIPYKENSKSTLISLFILK